MMRGNERGEETIEIGNGFSSPLQYEFERQHVEKNCEAEESHLAKNSDFLMAAVCRRCGKVSSSNKPCLHINLNFVRGGGPVCSFFSEDNKFSSTYYQSSDDDDYDSENDECEEHEDEDTSVQKSPFAKGKTATTSNLEVSKAVDEIMIHFAKIPAKEELSESLFDARMSLMSMSLALDPLIDLVQNAENPKMSILALESKCKLIDLNQRVIDQTRFVIARVLLEIESNQESVQKLKELQAERTAFALDLQSLEKGIEEKTLLLQKKSEEQSLLKKKVQATSDRLSSIKRSNEKRIAKALKEGEELKHAKKKANDLQLKIAKLNQIKVQLAIKVKELEELQRQQRESSVMKKAASISLPTAAAATTKTPAVVAAPPPPPMPCMQKCGRTHVANVSPCGHSLCQTCFQDVLDLSQSVGVFLLTNCSEPTCGRDIVHISMPDFVFEVSTMMQQKKNQIGM